MPSSSAGSGERVGRYALLGEIAAGGMATVHFGKQRGAAGFARIVAIKRLHRHLAKDDDFRAMLLDEARIAARVRHPNVVATIDVVEASDEVLLVMDYVAGESLSRLIRRTIERSEHVPTDVAVAIMCDMLQGLHAAHEARNEKGEPLGIVHRDVSPQNVLVGADGIARLVDFGIAKAAGRIHETREGQVKGKLAYMAPEQLKGKSIDRRCDIYAAGVVMWEMLVGQRLFLGESEGETVTNVLSATIRRPSELAAWVPRELDQVVMRAIQRDPAARYATARDMATVLESAVDVGTARTVSSWVQSVAGDVLAQRAETVAALEREPDTSAYDRPSLQPGTAMPITIDTKGSKPSQRWPLVVVPLVAVGALVAAAFMTGHRQSSALTPAVPIPASSTAPPVETVLVTPPVQAPEPRPSSEPSATVRRPARPPATSATPPRPAPSSSGPCVVKTYTDADGIVRFRTECGK